MAAEPDDMDMEVTGTEAANQYFECENDAMFVDRKLWNRHQSKLLRSIGVPYISVTGQIRAGRTLRMDCGCRRQCLSSFSRSELRQVFDQFNQLANKELQDEFLGTMILPVAVQRRRSACDADSSDHSNASRQFRRRVTYQYRLQVGDRTKRVCSAALCSAFGLKSGRLKRVASLMGTMASNDCSLVEAASVSSSASLRVEHEKAIEASCRQKKGKKSEGTSCGSVVDYMTNFLRTLPNSSLPNG